MLIKSHAQLLHSFTKCLVAKLWDSADVTSLSSHPWLQYSPTCYPVPPWVVMFQRISEMLELRMCLFVDHVYSHFGGYKLMLSLHIWSWVLTDEALIPNINLEIRCEKKFQIHTPHFPSKERFKSPCSINCKTGIIIV